MTLIMEGCNLTGKTTLAKNLGWPIEDKDPTRGPEAVFETQLTIESGNTIWNRCWLTEEVYGSLFRDYPGFTVPQLWRMGLHQENVGATLLHLSIDLALTEERFDSRGDEEMSLPEIHFARHQYPAILANNLKYLPAVCMNSKLEDALYIHANRQNRVEELRPIRDYSWGSLKQACTMVVVEKSFNLHFPFRYHGGTRYRKAVNFYKVWDSFSDPRSTRFVVLEDVKDWAKLVTLVEPSAILCVGKRATKECPCETRKYIPEPQALMCDQELDEYKYDINECLLGR